MDEPNTQTNSEKPIAPVKTKITTERLQNLIAKKDGKALQKIFIKVPDIDIAEAANSLSPTELIFIFRCVESKYTADFFDALDQTAKENLVKAMDEPTNFLDQSQVAWLANYLIAYPKAFLVISHDEAFLKQIAQVVFVLENQTITRYKGSFEQYQSQHALDKIQYQKNYDAQQRYIKKEEVFIAKHIVRATSSKAAKSHRARLEHLEVMDAPGKEEGRVFFNFPFTHDVGAKPLEVNELVIGYGKPLLDPISFVLKAGEKIAILGQNGVGKTTFLRTILDEIPSLGGSFKWLEGTVVNYYNQDEDVDLELTPFDYVKKFYPDLTNTEVRTLLGAVGVRKDLALRKMKELSGGEMTKARFAVMTKKKSNFLVFDEPTNHLDQKAKDALFAAIERYPGAVIIVSHEKDFYDGLVDYELNF